MTKPSKKPASTGAQRDTTLRSFDELVASAGVQSQASALARTGADTPTLDAELTRAFREAHDRWGLGLQHLAHDARLQVGDDATDVTFHADGREVARLSHGAASIAATYESMRALNADNLSEWGVLPDGHRVTIRNAGVQMRVLVEDARDFETHWTPDRSGAFTRTWRRADILTVEAHRPASPTTALADAAWDTIAAIRDRNLQRELLERSNSVGMLGALLTARHKNAAQALERLPEAHFTVRSTVVRASGAEARDYDRWKAMVREATQQLDELQKSVTRGLAEVLRHGLK